MDSPSGLSDKWNQTSWNLLFFTTEGWGNSIASVLVKTPLVTSGGDHNSNRCQLSVSAAFVDGVVQKTQAMVSHSYPWAPGASETLAGCLPSAQAPESWLCHQQVSLGAKQWPAAPASVDPSSSPSRDRGSPSAVRVPELRLAHPIVVMCPVQSPAQWLTDESPAQLAPA